MNKVYEILKIKQFVKEVEYNFDILNNPETAAKIATMTIGDSDREELLVLCLNTKNKVVAIHSVSVGIINQSIAHPATIFKTAILNNAASIILAHNHPSYDVTPSEEDIDFTDRVVEAGKLIGIPVLDHIIVNGVGGYYSIKEGLTQSTYIDPKEEVKFNLIVAESF
ncbi:JAB domain-containing protein [Geomicrobium sediminis]|uniref:DNA repair protein RadC n=1 Tax=Geomicrobium sediminis TaxID=1347788 RepID=A0ABS2PFL0_9BACL|nr:JAB domain-containing protein [Geomicrobium sediminis]MBM7634219.1 DNA repair protein RadC [Geomicrobium sediminis]